MRKESPIIRVIGAIVGFAMLIIFPVAAWQDLVSMLSVVSGVIVGLVFLLYGLGGRKSVAKVLPGAGGRSLW